MLRAILNKSWRQHPARHQLYGHLPPITKTIQVRRTRQAGHCWGSKEELISDVLLWTPAYGRANAGQMQDDQLEHTYSSYVRIRVVALKSGQRWWIIGRSDERGSGISVLAARHDHDDDDTLICAAFKSLTIWSNVQHVSAPTTTILPPAVGANHGLNWHKLKMYIYKLLNHPSIFISFFQDLSALIF